MKRIIISLDIKLITVDMDKIETRIAPNPVSIEPIKHTDLQHNSAVLKAKLAEMEDIVATRYSSVYEHYDEGYTKQDLKNILDALVEVLER